MISDIATSLSPLEGNNKFYRTHVPKLHEPKCKNYHPDKKRNASTYFKTRSVVNAQLKNIHIQEVKSENRFNKQGEIFLGRRKTIDFLSTFYISQSIFKAQNIKENHITKMSNNSNLSPRNNKSKISNTDNADLDDPLTFNPKQQFFYTKDINLMNELLQKKLRNSKKIFQDLNAFVARGGIILNSKAEFDERNYLDNMTFKYYGSDYLNTCRLRKILNNTAHNSKKGFTTSPMKEKFLNKRLSKSIKEETLSMKDIMECDKGGIKYDDLRDDYYIKDDNYTNINDIKDSLIFRFDDESSTSNKKSIKKSKVFDKSNDKLQDKLLKDKNYLNNLLFRKKYITCNTINTTVSTPKIINNKSSYKRSIDDYSKLNKIYAKNIVNHNKEDNTIHYENEETHDHTQRGENNMSLVDSPYQTKRFNPISSVKVSEMTEKKDRNNSSPILSLENLKYTCANSPVSLRKHKELFIDQMTSPAASDYKIEKSTDGLVTRTISSVSIARNSNKKPADIINKSKLYDFPETLLKCSKISNNRKRSSNINKNFYNTNNNISDNEAKASDQIRQISNKCNRFLSKKRRINRNFTIAQLEIKKTYNRLAAKLTDKDIDREILKNL